MSRITGEKNSAVLIFIGDHTMTGPRPHGEQFKGNTFPERVAEFFRRIERFQFFLLDVAHVQPPQLFAVHSSDGAVYLPIDNLILDRRTMLDVVQ
jgi:hypothetical protein